MDCLIDKSSNNPLDWCVVETHNNMSDGCVSFKEPNDYSNIHSGISNLIWDIHIKKNDGSIMVFPSVDIRLFGYYKFKDYNNQTIIGIGTSANNLCVFQSLEILTNVYKSFKKLYNMCIIFHEWSCEYPTENDLDN